MRKAVLLLLVKKESAFFTGFTSPCRRAAAREFVKLALSPVAVML
jgi:hypothetical protein